MKKAFVFLCFLCLVFSLTSVCYADDPGYTETVVYIPNGDHEIPATVCLPAGEGPFPAVVMLHGTASNRNESNNAYGLAAQTFAEKYGLATIRIDFIGSGESKADYIGYTFESAVSDASAACQYMQSLDGIDPERIGVLGWSQGGTDALLCAARRPELFKSVVTWAGAPDLKMGFSFDEKLYEEVKAKGYYEFSLGYGEPLKISLQWFEDVLNTDVLGEFAENYSGPVLAIHGKDDGMVFPVWSERIAAASKNPLSDTLFIDGMEHTFNVYIEEDFHSLFIAIDASGEFFVKTLKES